MQGKVTKVRMFQRYSGLNPHKVAGLRRSNKLENIEAVEKLDENYIPWLLAELEGKQFQARTWKGFKWASGRIWKAVQFARDHADLFTLSTREGEDGKKEWRIGNHAWAFLIEETLGTPYRVRVERTVN